MTSITLASEQEIQDAFKTLFHNKPSETGDDIYYPSDDLIQKVKTMFLKVVLNTFPLPFIQFIPNDTAIEAFWERKELVCSFYNGLNDDDPTKCLKPHYSFRGLDSKVEIKKGEIDNPKMIEEFKDFLSQ